MTDPAYDAPEPMVKAIEIEIYQPGHPSVISMTLDDIANLSTEEVSLWLRSVERVSSAIGGWWLLMRRKEAFEANEDWGPQLNRYAVLFDRTPRTLHEWIKDAAKEHGLTELMDRIKAVQGGAPKQQRQLPKPKSPALKKSIKVPAEQELEVTSNYPNESKQAGNSSKQDNPPAMTEDPVPPPARANVKVPGRMGWTETQWSEHSNKLRRELAEARTALAQAHTEIVELRQQLTQALASANGHKVTDSPGF